MRPQKGTGQARAGHSRPPHWRHGAVAHGPRGETIWTFKLNKKVRRLGLLTALSQKLSEGRLHVVDSLATESLKTRALEQRLVHQGWTDKILFVDDLLTGDSFFRKASSNLPYVHTLPSIGLNVYDILKATDVVLTVDAVAALEERLSS
uniref:Large ribosomal subunit protein uL4m n=2 Tax=Octactis speculum TaxID=3111310 RepID=A0A7S2GQR9_9STRA|mmetsp:Transcript_54102/g.73923  ORF Transcript_54102/g.73923 Transcript_54102/m.73923 type:complete len:149 (+) Transcript_54102:560-1006(+)